MEVLDRVYTTFKNLDRDYARSKKTRSEFIRDKFGGNIDIGSMIILDAISSSSGDETAEDIEKLTFVKNIFASIKAYESSLDTLPDFTFKVSELYKQLLDVLNESANHGMHQSVSTQAQVNKADKDSIHFVATARSTRYTPMVKCDFVNAYNENMIGLLSSMYGDVSKVSLHDYYAVKGRNKLVKTELQHIRKKIKQ